MTTRYHRLHQWSGVLLLAALLSLTLFACAGSESAGDEEDHSGSDAPLDPGASTTSSALHSRDNPMDPTPSARSSSRERDIEKYPRLPLDGEGATSEGVTAHSGLPENGFRAIAGSPLSTFSIDVDAASYSNVRGYLNRGTLPPLEEIRIEEMINYFDYDYARPSGEHPFTFATETSVCPWEPRHRLVRVALKGMEIDKKQAAGSNLVFLIDVSGSMDNPEKLPLLKEGFYRLVDQLSERDRVAIVVYAGAAGLVLEPTLGSKKERIKKAIARLESGGSTAGGEGIVLAYDVAKKSFLKGGNNRVVLATDGDFNVGISDTEGLVSLIETKRDDGIFLSVLGFGSGNYQDEKMEQLADNGNGNYYYIDRLAEAERVLASGLTGTLHTIAKDVKLQIAFNPATVQAYRLIGYENRVLTAKEFDDDTKDAGELGAGHTVTAFYEIVPVGTEIGHTIDTSRGAAYVLEDTRPYDFSSSDLLHARLRYKRPEETTSRLIEHVVVDERKSIDDADLEFRFAAAVVEWGLLMRGSRYAGSASFDHVIERAKEAKGKDPNGYRKEFITLVRIAKELVGAGVTAR